LSNAGMHVQPSRNDLTARESIPSTVGKAEADEGAGPQSFTALAPTN
jgi:hypothetical protein